MITEVFIDLEKVFKGLGNIKQAKCVSNFYDWLNNMFKLQLCHEFNNNKMYALTSAKKNVSMSDYQ